MATQPTAGGTPSDAQRPTRQAHLRPYLFQPGHSGNRKGGPGRRPITDALMAELEAVIKSDDKTVAQALAKRLVALAAGNNAAVALRALEIILDRAEGKVVQRQELTGADGGAMQFESIGSRQELEGRLAALWDAAMERQQVQAPEAPKVIEAQAQEVVKIPPPVKKRAPAAPPRPVTKPSLDLAW